jgi:hypothetical protein
MRTSPSQIQPVLCHHSIGPNCLDFLGEAWNGAAVASLPVCCSGTVLFETEHPER